jgi:ubiquinone biosynthesis monooxygenase Coq7
MIIEMRTNHAGEYGAVQIYNGAFYGLKVHELLNPMIYDNSIEKALCFVANHKKAEQIHLAGIETLIPQKERSSLIPLWHISGFLVGFVPSIFGPRGILFHFILRNWHSHFIFHHLALYHTIAAVESFVEEHYQAQIKRLLSEGDNFPKLRETLENFCKDEVHHKDEAIEALLIGERDNEMFTDNKAMYTDLQNKSNIVQLWTSVVDKGSRIAVEMSKLF